MRQGPINRAMARLHKLVLRSGGRLAGWEDKRLHALGRGMTVDWLIVLISLVGLVGGSLFFSALILAYLGIGIVRLTVFCLTTVGIVVTALLRGPVWWSLVVLYAIAHDAIWFMRRRPGTVALLMTAKLVFVVLTVPLAREMLFRFTSSIDAAHYTQMLATPRDAAGLKDLREIYSYNVRRHVGTEGKVLLKGEKAPRDLDDIFALLRGVRNRLREAGSSPQTPEQLAALAKANELYGKLPDLRQFPFYTIYYPPPKFPGWVLLMAATGLELWLWLGLLLLWPRSKDESESEREGEAGQTLSLFRWILAFSVYLVVVVLTKTRAVLADVYADLGATFVSSKERWLRLRSRGEEA